MEVRWKGVSLPYKIFDKDQRVSHAPEAIRGFLLDSTGLLHREGLRIQSAQLRYRRTCQASKSVLELSSSLKLIHVGCKRQR
jgi:hypothetical protein